MVASNIGDRLIGNLVTQISQSSSDPITALLAQSPIASAPSLQRARHAECSGVKQIESATHEANGKILN
jgi:hypothetical protein